MPDINFFNDYIVVLKTAADKPKFDKYLKTQEIVNTPLDKLNMYIITALETQVTQIKRLDYVESVVVDIDIQTEIQREGVNICPPRGIVSVGSKYANWGIERMKIPPLWDNLLWGRGINVAIIDTGIAPHVHLYINKQVSFVPDESIVDLNGHGTLIAGIVSGHYFKPSSRDLTAVGIAPMADLFNVKAFNKNGVGKFIGIIASLNWCLENNANIACMGISFSKKLESFGLDYLGTMFRAIKESTDKGLIIVGITGTLGTSQVSQPASIQSAIIAIGSTNFNNQRSSFSNYGPGINYVAPGEYILSTYLNNSYVFASGTSLACAQVCGLISLLLEEDDSRNLAEINKILTENAIDLGRPGYDFEYGYGLVQAPPVEPLL